MTPVRHAHAPIHPLHLSGDLRAGDALDAAWPMATRALLRFSGSVQPGDATLARLDDQELQMLRVALAALNTIEPTSAA